MVAAIVNGEQITCVEAYELVLFLDIVLTVISVSATLANRHVGSIHCCMVHVVAGCLARRGAPGDVVGNWASGA